MNKTEKAGNVFETLGIFPEWRENRRGPPRKYTFRNMESGKIIKKKVDPQKAHNIQIAMKQAANREKIKITIQNFKTYLLIYRLPERKK